MNEVQPEPDRLRTESAKVILRRLALAFAGTALISSLAHPQADESSLQVFGYFQSTFRYMDIRTEGISQKSTSFGVQQLNIMLQKDLAENLTSFVDLEFLNSFSTEQGWGDLNLEEAWIRYRFSSSFNLKVGLSIPVFNNLNEIKNRTPILPYITRPLVYETSFGEFISIDEFVPRRAFLEVFGSRPISSWKWDYAVFLGNSPHINSDPIQGQTASDTTTTMLVGGRTGLRWRESVKFGISLTHDRSSAFQQLHRAVGLLDDDFYSVPRVRLGVDLSANLGDLTLEGELIQVNYVDDAPDFADEPLFYYGTIGFQFTDRLYAFVSHWVTTQKELFDGPESSIIVEPISIVVPNLGCAYSLHDRVTLKAHFAQARISVESLDVSTTQWYAAAAVSVFF